MSQTKQEIQGLGQSEMEKRKKLFEAFGQKPSESKITPTKQIELIKRGTMAEMLETAYAELNRCEETVLKAKRPNKPSVLAGKFEYVESVLKSYDKRLSALKREEEQGAKVGKTIVTKRLEEVQGKLDGAKTATVRLSLQALTALVNRASTSVADQEKAAKADNADLGKIYHSASPQLTELTMDLTDWTAQVGQAKDFLGKEYSAFALQLETLRALETRLSDVVASCLPKLTSRIAAPGEKPVAAGGGGKVAVIETGKELEALQECGMSWVTAKQTYGADKTQMQKLADFRQSIVDKMIADELEKNYGIARGTGKGWVSVGSKDPTSDYDISLNKHGTTKDGKIKFDYEMVAQFNDKFRQTYKGEAGTVFDTNLYASAPPLVENDDKQKRATNDVAALMKMRRYMSAGEFEAFRVETVKACGNNINQVMEVEQNFVLADSNYRIVMLDEIESGQKKLAEKTASFSKKPENELTDQQKHELEFLHKLEDYLQRGKNVSGIASADLIEEGEELGRELEHELKDATLLTTNDLYTDKTGAVRKQEQMIALLNDLSKALAAKDAKKDDVVKKLQDTKQALIDLDKDVPTGPFDSALQAINTDDEKAFAVALEGVSKSVARMVDGRMTQLNAAASIAKFFANEAYQSDGPFAHVVTATQAAEAEATNEVINQEAAQLSEEAKKDLQPHEIVARGKAGGVEAFLQLEKTKQEDLLKQSKKQIDDAVIERKKREQDKLSPEDCLTSFNEQLGDFLKDLAHYGEDDPGKAIIQSSKYLERLIDAVRLMHDKQLFAKADSLTQEIGDLLNLQSSVKNELIAARKGNLLLMPQGENLTVPVNQAEQRRAYACEFMKKLGVTSVAGLGKKYTALAIKVNAAARHAMANT